MKAFIFKSILAICRFLSLKQSRSLARLLGKLAWKFSKKNKLVTQTNINKCYPHLSSKQQQQLAQDSINATIMHMLELGKLWDKNTQADDIVDNIYGLDEFKNALAQNQGLLLAAPHIGNWEVLNLVLAQFDKYAFLYKPPTDKTLEDLLIKYRGKSKALQIEANLAGVRKIMLHLKKSKGLIAILPDQRPKQGQGVFVPFYGIATYTMTLFAKLAAKTKAPVFFAYALRTDQGFEVYFEKSGDLIYQELAKSVTYMNSKIQQIVDKAPAQYQWSYKRFSIQPEGEKPFYDS
ncbi:MAG: lysophospholipid acyltransferase family protein [Proteobacteria bacterium]|nr:lysophospholipid acyltransferase family protein [Pseudomonadota bacterium]